MGGFMPGNGIPAGQLVGTTSFTGIWQDERFAGLPWGTFGWAAYILPFVEATTIYDQINFNCPAYTPFFEEYTSNGQSTGRGNGLTNNGVQVAGAGPNGFGDLANALAATSVPKTFICPSARRGLTPGGPAQYTNLQSQKDYGINGGLQTGGCCAERSTTKSDEGMAWLGSQVSIHEVTDGTSNTFLFFDLMNYAYHGRIDEGFGSNPFFFVNEAGQGYVMAVSQGSATSWATNLTYVLLPNTEVGNDRGAESDHAGGIFVALVDGHVTWVANNVDPNAYIAGFTRYALTGEPAEAGSF